MSRPKSQADRKPQPVPATNLCQDQVAVREGEIRLDRWFQRHHPGLPHSLLAKLARKGELRVDGRRVALGDRVKPGHIIGWPKTLKDTQKGRETGREKTNRAGNHKLPDKPSRPLCSSMSQNTLCLADFLIYRDEAVLVLNKPSGLAVQGGSKLTFHIDGHLDSLRFGRSERPRLVHRLDKETSGLLLIGRTPAAAASLAAAFRSRRASKIYWALVCRPPHPPHGRIESRLTKQAKGNKEQVILDPQGKQAITFYHTLDTAADRAAWLALQPLTGRTHQLRVHCAALGSPIQGDRKYGNRSLFLSGAIRNRLHLHAREITLPHPDGGELRICAPLSDHMAESWQVLGFDPASPPPG